MLLTGASSAVVLCVVIQGLLFRHKSQNLIKTLRRGMIYGTIGFAFYSVTNNQLIDIIYTNHPDYAEVYKQHIVNRDDPQVIAKMDSLKLKIWGIDSNE